MYDIPTIGLDEDIVIYGGGEIGKALAKYFKNYSNVVIADYYYKKIVSIDGISVISEVDAFEKYPNSTYFIANAMFGEILYEKAIKNGVNKDQIIISDYVSDINNQYFDFFTPKENEIFVDAGVFDAFSSIQFTDWSKNFKKIYLFEPDVKNYIKSKEKLDESNITKYELIKIGLWDRKKILNFDENGSSSAINSNNSEGIEIEVDSLDNILNGREATFIKMDIEGAELKALHGAEQTIKTHKPRLAICVYHKVGDILEIPLYLKSILPEYKFALRHYTSKLQETVLYAWVE